MSKGTVVWALIAVVLIILGVVLFIINGRRCNYTVDLDGEVVEKTFDVAGEVKDVKIDVDVADVHILKSLDGACKLIYSESDTIKYKVEYKDEKLTVTPENNSKFSLNFGSFTLTGNKYYMTLYLPETEFDKLNVNSDTGEVLVDSGFVIGDVEIESDTGAVKFLAEVKNKLKIEGDTGAITLDGVKARDIELDNDTGRIKLENTIAENSIDIDNSTGSIEFYKIDAKSIDAECSTGSITGSILTDKQFTTKVGAGSVKVPASAGEGTCKLKTSTGSINIEIAK